MSAAAQTTSEALSEQVRSAILGGEYAPGQRLIEAELTGRFGASRSQVRAAIASLAGQGLVEVQRNRGARVRPVSLLEAIQITQVRRLLEGFTAARAAERRTPAQIAELSRIAADMRAAAQAGEPTTYHELNGQLHQELRTIADHRISAELLGQLRDLTARHRSNLALMPGRLQESLPQHEAIVEAVIAGDARAAEGAMHTHLQSVVDALTASANATTTTQRGV